VAGVLGDLARLFQPNPLVELVRNTIEELVQGAAGSEGFPDALVADARHQAVRADVLGELHLYPNVALAVVEAEDEAFGVAVVLPQAEADFARCMPVASKCRRTGAGRPTDSNASSRVIACFRR
jgi:hypothetical protein